MEWFQERQKQSLVVLLLLIAGIFYASRNQDQSAEAQVKTAIKDMIEAAETKNIATFKKYFSEEIRDEQGRSKEDILNTLRVIFLRHQKISLHLIELDVQDSSNPDIISTNLALLMSETAVPTDKGNFSLTFRREGDVWRVWEVKWQGGYGY